MASTHREVEPGFVNKDEPMGRDPPDLQQESRSFAYDVRPEKVGDVFFDDVAEPMQRSLETGNVNAGRPAFSANAERHDTAVYAEICSTYAEPRPSKPRNDSAQRGAMARHSNRSAL